MLPEEEDFREWQGHPVTEWVMDRMRAMAAAQKGKWAEMAWQGNLDPALHREANVRADCYLAIPECTYEDWKAIDDSDD